MSFKIPLMTPIRPTPERDTPISPRENLMLALNHQKPLWMPNLYADSQCVLSKCNRDTAPRKDADGYDWFGTYYKYSPVQFSNTPTAGVFKEIGEWRDKVKWPDLNAIDWTADLEGFVRDERLALYTRMSNGPFERLHFFEGFEQALMDIFVEPEECRAFFERYVDHRIEVFNHMRDVFPFDYIVAADDYSTARAPFFSTELYEKILLEPTRRFVKAVQARGTKFIAHCCGMIDVFIPYFADLGVDGLEIQSMNDISSIYEKYGDKLTVEYATDKYVVFDPENDEAALRQHVRDIVDQYGAHKVNGAGVVMNIGADTDERYFPMEDELYNYSRKLYTASENT